MQKGKENVIGGMVEETSEVDVCESGEGEKTDRLVRGGTRGEYAERLEE